MVYKIVCVDDENGILDLYKDILSDFSYDVHTFSNPVEAFTFIEKNNEEIVLVISDYKMPEMSGFELRQKTLDIGMKAPFCVITAFYEQDLVNEAISLSVCKLLSKPFSFEDVEGIVRDFIEDREKSLDEDRELVEGFLEETLPMVEEIEDLILELETDPKNLDITNTYFRILHTIKGTAACVGLSNLSHYAHEYENFISLLKKKELEVNKNVIDVLLKGLDGLKQYVQYIVSHYEDEKIDKESLAHYLEYSLANLREDNKEDSEKKDTAASKKAGSSPSREGGEKTSISISLLDSFMELSGEVTVIRNSMMKKFKDIESLLPGHPVVDQMSDFLYSFHKVTSQMQAQINFMRKVTLGSVTKPYKRIIRDIAKSNSKEVDFNVVGEDILIDTQMAKTLSNCLIHLVRNSIDHGIEPVSERLEKGKEREGKVSLEAYDRGEFIEVKITDNGRGLNSQILKDKALEKGMYSQSDLENMSEKRIFDMIFESGFSTAKEITDISGRGVGMDMVKSSITQKGGKILIDSKVNEGSSFTLQLPYPKSVLIVNSLLVAIRDYKFVIPTEEISDVNKINLNSSLLKKMGDDYYFQRESGLCRLIQLEEILGLKEVKQFKENLNVVFLNNGNKEYGLIVDEIIDLEEVVKRKLWSSINQNISYFCGACVLGSGEVVLMLDNEGIAQNRGLKIEETMEENQEFKKEDQKEIFEYLLFSLDSNEHFAVELKYVDRMEMISSKLIEYSTGNYLVKYRGRPMPLILPDTLLHLSEDSFNPDKIDKINLVVVSCEQRLYGFVVKEVFEICQVENNLNSDNIDRKGIKGTFYYKEKTKTAINVEEILAEYSFTNKRVDKSAA